uniref:Zf-RING_UBOX domain-containing protein n=1 Tax=Rhabditophanes sp. KR3021 TaxID=114890 RepID=A0AC35UD87_9BILA
MNLSSLTCRKCYNLFTNPVTLSCGHSYCRDDIFPNYKSLSTTKLVWCDTCKTNISFDAELLNVNIALKGKLYLKKVIIYLLDVSEKYKEKYLQSGGIKKKQECRGYFNYCSECRDFISATETYNCATCQPISTSKKPICADCGWRVHKNHNFYPQPLATNETKADLLQSLSNLKTEGQLISGAFKKFHDKLAKQHIDIANYGIKCADTINSVIYLDESLLIGKKDPLTTFIQKVDQQNEAKKDFIASFNKRSSTLNFDLVFLAGQVNTLLQNTESMVENQNKFRNHTQNDFEPPTKRSNVCLASSQ